MICPLIYSKIKGHILYIDMYSITYLLAAYLIVNQ